MRTNFFMKKSDEILYNLISEVRKVGNEILIPNFYVGSWEMDLFRQLNSGYISEYEIKISRADFRNDFKKSTEDIKYNREEKKVERTNFRTKHELMAKGEYVANKFFFVVPYGMVQPNEVPEYAGLIYYRDDTNYLRFETVKPAKFIHRKKSEIPLDSLIKSLCYREFNMRLKNRILTQKIKSLNNERKKNCGD